MPLDLIAELEALIESFDRDVIPYALCGGLAVAVHGHPRATMDIDLLVPADALARAVIAAKHVGFDIPARRMTFGRKSGQPREIQRISKLDPDTQALMPLDLILVGPILEEVWRDRVMVIWRGREIAIVSRSGLATMKRLAGRPQDLADLAALEGNTDDEDED